MGKIGGNSSKFSYINISYINIGIVAFNKKFWRTALLKQFAVTFDDAPTQRTGTKGWSFDLQDRLITDPHPMMLQTLLNSEKNLFTFGCCMLFTIMTAENIEDGSDENDPLFVPNFYDELLSHHNNSVIFSLAIEMKTILSFVICLLLLLTLLFENLVNIRT